MPIINKIIVKDLGWKEIKKQLKKTNNSAVKVGFPENISPMQIIKIALVNELGTRDIPSRPFMFISFQKNTSTLIKMSRKLYLQILKGIISTERALEIMGAFLQDKTKEEISGFSSPANAPSTIQKKGFNDPLVDEGKMRDSVTSKVVNK